MTKNKSSRNLRQRLFTMVSVIVLISTLITPLPNTVYAISAPNLISPADTLVTTPDEDSYPPLGVPSFVWEAVPDATLYKLQISNDIAFTSIALDINTPNTTYTPTSMSTSLFADGIWYWRVRVETPSPVSNWSNTWSFTKWWATVDNKPILLSPENAVSLAFFNAPDFSWTPVIGASKYRFLIAASEDGFNSPILSKDTLATTIQPNDRLANGEYWWKVIPLDPGSHLGTASEVRKFTLAYGTSAMNLVPTLLEPADESFPTFTPSFKWTAVEGAEHYRLEYTSDEDCDFSVGTIVETRQTSFTPTDTFPNDLRYCWHVRAEAGAAVGDYTEIWHFQKKWYLQPQLLTPTNLFQNGLYPLYSWTPVPGAARYKIEIDNDPTFTPPLIETYTTANTTYSPQEKYIGTEYYYWRVTPIDGGVELGLVSDFHEFQSYYTSTAPILVYPLYYYPPNDPIYYGDYLMDPYEDRTVAHPVFAWHRVMIPAPDGGVYAKAYRIQVDTTPYFSNIIWQYDTENTIASPTIDNNFTPQVGEDYYWRVCVIDELGAENCRADPSAGWSQVWRARFDSALALPYTSDVAPELLRPSIGQESVEATPLLEWYPLQDATQYKVEIDRDPTFSTVEYTNTATVSIPAFAPWHSIAQRSLDRLDYGTFYWRVQGSVNGDWSEWSDPGRFQIASQSEWRLNRTLGDPDNQLQIGYDELGDAQANYDLMRLYAAQQQGDWFFGFNANLTTPDMTYVIYLDIDHVDSSGATSPPERSYQVTTIPAHQPEFAIYIDQIDSIVNAQNTWIFAWNGVYWEFGQSLNDIGGDLYWDSDYVEIRIPNAAIGMDERTSSASVILFSVNNTTYAVEDSVPSDPQVPGTAQLSRFSAVSEHMNLVSPPNTASGDPSSIPSVLPFFWDWPTGCCTSNPFAGSVLEVHLDPEYTNRVGIFTINSNTDYFSENNVTFLEDIIGDNIYYWRVRPRYGVNGPLGAWTSGWSFRRIGFTAQISDTTPVNLGTPTFNWDMVEGAQSYRIQVSTDPNFGSTLINQVTPMTSYTPQTTLVQGTYYWRVQVNRYDVISNDWSEVKQLSLTLPTPNGLAPDSGTVVHSAPTLCWDPIFEPPDPETPILTAWKYRLQVSRDENFSSIYESVDTVNRCWTPLKGYDDGTYYWHVAMIDGNGRLGSYSYTATFTKQYPITTLISPSGAVASTPTFIWTPVDGARTYSLQISQNPNFSPLYDNVETVNTQFTPTKLYQIGMVYYWRVAIRDQDGKYGPYTDATIIIGDAYRSQLPIVSK